MDGTYITATRTAAGSALATRLLAREDARVLAIVGTGVQARSHHAALTRLREWDEIRIAGRDRAKAEALAEELGATAARGPEDAIRGADVVAAGTHATPPGARSTRRRCAKPWSSSSRASRRSRRRRRARPSSSASIPRTSTPSWAS